MRASRAALRGALALAAVGAFALGACSEAPPTTPSGVSTATPTSTRTATASPSPATLSPERLRAMTAAELEPVLTAALVQRGDLPPATWRVTDVPLRDPEAALREAASGDLTRNLALLDSECFAAIPVGDPGSMGVMRVFSIATASQGTTVVSAAFRVRGNAQVAIDQAQLLANSPATADCLARAFAAAMTPQAPAGKVAVLRAGGSEGMPPGVGSMEFVGRITGGGQTYTLSLTSVAVAAGPVLAVVAEIAVVPRDEVPVLPGRPVDLLQAGGLRLGAAIGLR